MSVSEVAGAGTVRDEDAFDVAAVSKWLGEEITEVRQFRGGASNLTYLLVSTSSTGERRELILRRPPAGTKAKSAHDMSREYRIMAGLKPVFGKVPEMVGFCADTSVIGSEFYVMERLDGHIPRKELGIEMTPEQLRQLCTNTIDVLIELHQVDPAAAGLADLGKGEGYVARQISGWSDRYRKAKTWNVPSFETVMTWLDAEQPKDRGSCLIHNDFKFDNMVLDRDDPTQPIGLLDWEMATIGDPLMDLGCTLSYWIQADDDKMARSFRRLPTHLPGMLTRQEVVDYYCSRTGIELTDREWAFYQVYGLFRLAVIVQQIYYRYHHKQTTNPAFRHLWWGVVMLERRCRRIIKDVS